MKTIKYRLILVISFILLGFVSYGQSQFLADRYYDSYAYHDACDMYLKIIKKDKNNAYIIRRIASSYRFMNNSIESEYWYDYLITNSSDYTSSDCYYYAQALRSNKKYEKSKIWMAKSKANIKIDESMFNYKLEDIDNLITDSLKYVIYPVKINSSNSDFGPAFFNDKIVYSSSRNQAGIINREYKWNNQTYLDLYVSDISNNGDLMKTNKFTNILNSKYHDGPVCFSDNGKQVFITRNALDKNNNIERNKDGIVVLQLYSSKFKNGKWSKPNLMDINIEGYSSGHPSVSKDGKTLYFISDRPGGFGEKDIYISKKQGDIWTTPINLGSKVNTVSSEMFPFISDDNMLYFSSDGRVGLGGLDLYYVNADLLESSKVTNMGAKINSTKDDFALIIKNGKGYFSSNRISGESYDDIYHFTIKRRMISGVVFNKLTNDILPGAIVSLIDSDNKIVENIKTLSDASFSFYISDTKSYTLSSEKIGFTKGNTTIESKELIKGLDIYKEMFLEPKKEEIFIPKEDLKVGRSFVLKDIYYDLDESFVRPDASIELDKLVMLMRQHPSLKIELSSHTDCRASKQYNEKLSDRRAKAAVLYLSIKGIDANRLVARGYGESILVNECSDGVKCAEYLHQNNRRTEIKVLEFLGN